MDWLRENWFWLLVTVLFLFTHMGHRGHGGREGGGRRRRGERPPNDVGFDPDTNADDVFDSGAQRAPRGHRH